MSFDWRIGTAGREVGLWQGRTFRNTAHGVACAETASVVGVGLELTHEREIVRMAALLKGRQAWVA